MTEDHTLMDLLGSTWKNRPEILANALSESARLQLLQIPEYAKLSDEMKLEALRGFRSTKLENTDETIKNVHPGDQCSPPCPIHLRTNHPMRGWPQHWRSDMHMMERMCTHGVGHPDPDEKITLVSRTHGCDGCCALELREWVHCPVCHFSGVDLDVNIHRMESQHHGGPNV